MDQFRSHYYARSLKRVDLFQHLFRGFISHRRSFHRISLDHSVIGRENSREARTRAARSIDSPCTGRCTRASIEKESRGDSIPVNESQLTETPASKRASIARHDPRMDPGCAIEASIGVDLGDGHPGPPEDSTPPNVTYQDRCQVFSGCLLSSRREV